MDIEDVKRYQAEKDYLMRNEGKNPFGGPFGIDPNSDQVTPYPY